jgi:hypothetical protein
VTFILIVIAPLVVVLFVLIFRMNHMAHFTPQAYYRRKLGGAPLSGEYEALGPRPRKRGPADADSADDADDADDGAR